MYMYNFTYMCYCMQIYQYCIRMSCGEQLLYNTLEYYSCVDIPVYCTCICHPSPSNSQQETTNSMSHVTVVAELLLTLDHYQPQISIKLDPYIKYCTLDDKIVACLSVSCNYYLLSVVCITAFFGITHRVKVTMVSRFSCKTSKLKVQPAKN